MANFYPAELPLPEKGDPGPKKLVTKKAVTYLPPANTWSDETKEYFRDLSYLTGYERKQIRSNINPAPAPAEGLGMAPIATAELPEDVRKFNPNSAEWLRQVPQSLEDYLIYLSYAIDEANSLGNSALAEYLKIQGAALVNPAMTLSNPGDPVRKEGDDGEAAKRLAQFVDHTVPGRVLKGLNPPGEGDAGQTQTDLEQLMQRRAQLAEEYQHASQARQQEIMREIQDIAGQIAERARNRGLAPQGIGAFHEDQMQGVQYQPGAGDMSDVRSNPASGPQDMDIRPDRKQAEDEYANVPERKQAQDEYPNAVARGPSPPPHPPLSQILPNLPLPSTGHVPDTEEDEKKYAEDEARLAAWIGQRPIPGATAQRLPPNPAAPSSNFGPGNAPLAPSLPRVPANRTDPESVQQSFVSGGTHIDMGPASSFVRRPYYAAGPAAISAQQPNAFATSDVFGYQASGTSLQGPNTLAPAPSQAVGDFNRTNPLTYGFGGSNQGPASVPSVQNMNAPPGTLPSGWRISAPNDDDELKSLDPEERAIASQDQLYLSMRRPPAVDVQARGSQQVPAAYGNAPAAAGVPGANTGYDARANPNVRPSGNADGLRRRRPGVPLLPPPVQQELEERIRTPRTPMPLTPRPARRPPPAPPGFFERAARWFNNRFRSDQDDDEAELSSDGEGGYSGRGLKRRGGQAAAAPASKRAQGLYAHSGRGVPPTRPVTIPGGYGAKKRPGGKVSYPYKSDRFVPFGRLELNTAALHSIGAVRLRYPHSRKHLADIPQIKASPVMRLLVAKIADNPKDFDKALFRQLSDEEKDFLERILYRADIYGADLSNVLGREMMKAGDRDEVRLAVLIGQIEAGNNNPEVATRAITHLERLWRQKKITYPRFLDYLSKIQAGGNS